MSTNKTTNYQLHAWVPEDDFLRAEFNENFAKLDDSLRIVFGSYIGNCSTDNSSPNQIELGIRPRAVLITQDRGISTGGSYSYLGMAFPGIPAKGDALVLEETGFIVRNAASSFILLNTTQKYYYMALY